MQQDRHEVVIVFCDNPSRLGFKSGVWLSYAVEKSWWRGCNDLKTPLILKGRGWWCSRSLSLSSLCIALSRGTCPISSLQCKHRNAAQLTRILTHTHSQSQLFSDLQHNLKACALFFFCNYNKDVWFVLPQGFHLSPGHVGPDGLCWRKCWVSLTMYCIAKSMWTSYVY